MADKTPFKPFNRMAKPERVQVVKDNAQPRVKPPQMAHKPQPNLAPPGMSGIRTEKRFAFQKPPAPKPEFAPTQGNLRREFKSLVRNQTGKGHEIER